MALLDLDDVLEALTRGMPCSFTLRNTAWQEAGMTTEMLEEVVSDLVLLNSAYMENPNFYQIFARESVVEELTAPVREADDDNQQACSREAHEAQNE